MIPLTGVGGLFTRIGKIGASINLINANRGTAVPNSITAIDAQYDLLNQDVVDNIYTNLNSYQNASGNIMSPLQQIAANTVIEMANTDLLLNNLSISTALPYVVNQMNTFGQSVNACSVTNNQTYAATNIGNPQIVVSMKNQNGYYLEDAFNELITGIVTNDSQSNPNITGMEPIQLKGQYSIANTFSWLYPQESGSGLQSTISAVNAMQAGAGSTSNWTTNGSMELFGSPPTPNNWHIDTASAQVAQSTAVFYDGSSSVSFVGSATANTSIYQGFSTQSQTYDTPVVMNPNLQFSFNIFAKTSSMPPSGVLTASLVYGSAGSFVVLKDNYGTPNSVSFSLNTLGTTWKPLSGTFRTPNYIPAQVSFRIQLSTPMPSGYTLYLDRIGFSQMTQLYAGGPFVSIYSGNINMIRGDTMWLYPINDYGGGFQILFQKLFNMRSLNLLLPSNATGGETILDSLIS